LRSEVAGIAKAVELRVNEATGILAAFASGQISGEEAHNRVMRYQDRWGESAIPGVSGIEGRTNAEILKEMEEAIEPEVKKASWWRSSDTPSGWADRARQGRERSTGRED
jgi:hypothetical protein